MNFVLLDWLLIWEGAWAFVLLVLLAPALASRSWRRRQNRTAAEFRSGIYKSLAIYVGGNPDLTRLQAAATRHPEDFQDALQRFQTAVAGRCDALGELAFRLGLVSRWCDIAHTGSIEARRVAFSRLAAVAHYAPARRLATDVASQAAGDPDEQIRLAAAHVLLRSEDPWQIARLFERLLSDTSLIRCLIGPELRVYAGPLCRNVVPEVMRNIRTNTLVNTLQVMASWERGLPLSGLGDLANHSDALVRLEFMRLLPLLPAVLEYRKALLRGLSDQNARVRSAAMAAASRLKIMRNPDPAVSGAIQASLDLACAEGAA